MHAISFFLIGKGRKQIRSDGTVVANGRIALTHKVRQKFLRLAVLR